MFDCLQGCGFGRNKKKKKPTETDTDGFDNRVAIVEKDGSGTITEEICDSQNQQPQLLTPQQELVQQLPAEENKDVETEAKEKVVTMLIDDKRVPTNGFDVARGERSGDLVVERVLRGGPADGKLRRGDVIDSVTVFFDGVTYEKAVTLLSGCAACKIAVAVIRTPKQAESAVKADLDSGGSASSESHSKAASLNGRSANGDESIHDVDTAGMTRTRSRNCRLRQPPAASVMSQTDIELIV